jgi:hypothetical protein
VTRARLRQGLFGVLAAALPLAPRVAQACPVCTGGQKEEVGRAFFAGSLVLSLLPLLLIGAGAWWLRRRARAIERHEDASATSASRKLTHESV